MTEEIYLDLNKVELYGWEKYKSDKVIDYLISRIEACDEFPAVCGLPGEISSPLGAGTFHCF